MSELQIFENSEFGSMRTVEADNEIYFVGKDVAKILGYKEAANMRKIIDEVDYTEINPQSIENTGFVQNGSVLEPNKNVKRMLLINESGLYQAIFGSTLPKAKEFKRWVTSEVLPTIRKHGAYMTEKTLEEALTSPDFLIKLATELKSEKEKNLALQVKNSNLSANNAIMKPKADYFDELVDRNLLTNFRETAKQLKVKEKKFINFLMDKKYVYRDKKGKLLPYADKNQGLFEVKESVNEKTNWSGIQTLITPKGRETFRLLFIS